MTLLDQQAAISKHAKSLQEKGKIKQYLGDVDAVRSWITDQTEKTLKSTEAMRGLRSIDVAPSVEHAKLEQAVKVVEKMLQGERTLVTNPTANQRALNDVAAARKVVTRSLQESHSEWRDSTVGDLEPIVSFAQAVKQVWAEVHAEVTRLVAEIKEGRNSLPTTESLGRVNKAVERLREIPRELAPTDETQRFLVAACGNGATFRDLTESVREWLKAQGLERRLIVRISGSGDD